MRRPKSCLAYSFSYGSLGISRVSRFKPARLLYTVIADLLTSTSGTHFVQSAPGAENRPKSQRCFDALGKYFSTGSLGKFGAKMPLHLYNCKLIGLINMILRADGN